jgi:ribosomal protein S18 acetylase RimI-like enzyme
MIREADSTDYQCIEKTTKENMLPFYKVYAKDWNDEVFFKSLVETQNFVIFENGKFIATLRVSFTQHHLYINDLQVATQFQGMGFGTKLIDHAVLLTKTKNLGAIRLCVFKCNTARKFYENMGFRLVGEQGDLFRMEKII